MVYHYQMIFQGVGVRIIRQERPFRGCSVLTAVYTRTYLYIYIYINYYFGGLIIHIYIKPMSEHQRIRKPRLFSRKTSLRTTVGYVTASRRMVDRTAGPTWRKLTMLGSYTGAWWCERPSWKCALAAEENGSTIEVLVEGSL